MENSMENIDNSKSGELNFKCDACDFVEKFENEKEAYLAGWSFSQPVKDLIVSFCPACSKEKI